VFFVDRVNVDIDVPLFLPLSGQRRLYDLRRTARLEDAAGVSMHGQMNFESGWEFGYWISNLVTARAVYNPLMDVSDDWDAFRTALTPVARMFASSVDASLSGKVIDSIVSLAKMQAELMVYGNVNGQPPADISKLSGHAYLSGGNLFLFSRLPPCCEN
jgi:hypothetical protein